MSKDILDANKLVNDYVEAYRQRYGHSSGNAMVLGALMAHVGFYLSGDTPVYSVTNMEKKIEQLLMEIMTGDE